MTYFSQAFGNPADLNQASPVSSTLSIAKSMISEIQQGYCGILPIGPSCNHVSPSIPNSGSFISYAAMGESSDEAEQTRWYYARAFAFFCTRRMPLCPEEKKGKYGDMGRFDVCKSEEDQGAGRIFYCRR